MPQSAVLADRAHLFPTELAGRPVADDDGPPRWTLFVFTAPDCRPCAAVDRFLDESHPGRTPPELARRVRIAPIRWENGTRWFPRVLPTLVLSDSDGTIHFVQEGYSRRELIPLVRDGLDRSER
jgi:hypothetical protein